MTIERPMFPPRAESVDSFSHQPAIGQPETENSTSYSPSPVEDVDSPGNVIRFDFSVSRKAHARKARAAKVEAKATQPAAANGSMPETARNGRLRQERHEDWRAAEAALRYWGARLDLHSAISYAQRMETPEGRSHPTVNEDERWSLVGKYREALVRQLLTPAWDANSVKWKQDTFAKGQHKHADANPKKLERSIADDLAWLAAHPTRRSNSEARARSREFKAEMRRRVMEVAISRDLSDEEIKPVLKLKHEEVGRFAQKYGVNLAWLLEGAGPMFWSGAKL
jgi:hypothetical protein